MTTLSVLFDLDGTLVDSTASPLDAVTVANLDDVSFRGGRQGVHVSY